MRQKEIIIIGAGMGGLAAGIYGRRNGFGTRIFEMHSRPGGQCCSWRRKGYTFDPCIHHLFGCSEGSRIHQLWRELGAMPRELVDIQECTAVASSSGVLFRDYYQAERLRAHLDELAPRDWRTIDNYLRGIERAGTHDVWGEAMLGTRLGLARMLPSVFGTLPWARVNMKEFAERFSDPFLRRAFPLLEYSDPNAPFLLHLIKQGLGRAGGIRWPLGGAAAFARSIERRYRELGGEVHYRQPVVKILTRGDRAVGVRCKDGAEHWGDVVISDADGRRTILELLEGRFIDDRIRSYCAEPADQTNWAVHVFLGVNRDLRDEPSALVLLLDEPVTIAGHRTDSLEMQIYGFDPSMAPAGKGVIKVELVSSYSYWKQLHAQRALYDEEKHRTADTVIGLLERRWPGLRGQVEVVDVPTLMTWERYMGGTHGFANMPAKKQSLWSLFGRGEHTLPGLRDFYFVGAWSTSTGALFANACSGRRVIQRLCREDGRKFIAS